MARLIISTYTASTYGLVADVSYDWKGERWTVPVSVTAAQLTKVGDQLVSIGGALRYHVASNEFAAHGFAGRFSVTLLVPQ